MEIHRAQINNNYDNDNGNDNRNPQSSGRIAVFGDSSFVFFNFKNNNNGNNNNMMMMMVVMFVKLDVWMTIHQIWGQIGL